MCRHIKSANPDFVVNSQASSSHKNNPFILYKQETVILNIEYLIIIIIIAQFSRITSKLCCDLGVL